MPTLIDTLTSTSDAEPEVTRVRLIKSHFPQSPHELFEALAELGAAATFTALVRAINLQQADAHGLIMAFLERVPSLAELRALPEPYEPRGHLAAVLGSIEFRRFLAQRILTAYPEKRRLLFARVPHCGGGQFLKLLAAMHPLFPARLTAPRIPRDFLTALGDFLARLQSNRTVMLASPRLSAFWTAEPPALDLPALDPPALDQIDDRSDDEFLPWTLRNAAYRAPDRLFTIIRDPEEIVLAQVNRMLAALARPAEADDPLTARWRVRLHATLAACDPADLRPLGRRILALFPDRDPICHALGDGTCASTLDACVSTNVEIADFETFDAWFAKTWFGKTWDNTVEHQELGPPPVLKREDLSRRDLERLADLTAQDRLFYASTRAARIAGQFSVAGSSLSP